MKSPLFSDMPALICMPFSCSEALCPSEDLLDPLSFECRLGGFEGWPHLDVRILEASNATEFILKVRNDFCFGYLSNLFHNNSNGNEMLRQRLLRWILRDSFPSCADSRELRDGIVGKSHSARRRRAHVRLVVPIPSEGFATDRSWGRMLSRLIRRRATLCTKLYYLSTVGGGWAAVRRVDMCLVYAAKQYAIAKKLQDELTISRCRLYLGYHEMWVGNYPAAHAIFQHELYFAMLKGNETLEKAVKSGIDVLESQWMSSNTSAAKGFSFDAEADLTTPLSIIRTCDALCKQVARTNVSDHALEQNCDSDSDSDEDIDLPHESDCSEGASCASAPGTQCHTDVEPSGLEEMWTNVFACGA